ncbi:uncharacterized protein [Cicer arietinum]|uniref:Uncharacterized protein LOC101504473 n=1 Tax=Cicer arietinum TaxID=3827 RepID=A0A1S2Z5V4_CICAR|nr:uncharacterized protein LOC101504473 [Cicer arietinum]
MSRVEVSASRNRIDSTNKFITDQVFPSREAVFEWAKTIGRENGILIVTIRSDKLQRVKIVGTDKTICGCSIRTTHGLPCACELAKLQISGNVIPLDSIHVFWRKLSLENELEDEESLSDYDFSEELEAMKAYTKKHDIIIDVVADGNCGFRAIAALLGWTEESWPLVRTQLDKEIHLHQDLYANVFDDSVESVRSSLNISGLGAQGQDKWMCLPDLGYVIATQYNVILVSLSRNLNMTFFPLNKAPPSKERLLAIGFVNGNHWVQIKLKSNCPLPPISQKWKDYCNECAQWVR